MQSVLIDAFKESRPERINFGFKIAVFSIVDNPCDYAKYFFLIGTLVIYLCLWR